MAKLPEERKAGGRPKGSVSRQSSKQRALKLKILTYIEPHIAEAMDVMIEVMRDPNEKGQTRITAAKFVTEKAQELIEKILTPEDDGTSEDSEEKAEVVDIKPRLSLTVPTKKD